MRRTAASVGVKLRVFAVLALMVSFLAVTEWPSIPAAEACPFTWQSGATLVVADCAGGGGGASGGGGAGSSGGGGGGGGGPVCTVVWGHDSGDDRVENSDALRNFYTHFDLEPPPDDVTWWWDQCASECGTPLGCSPSDLASVTGGIYWTEPVDLEPGEPWEALLLPEVWAMIEGSLTAPDVHLDPPGDDPAIVQVPTFVSVDDPPDTLTASHCAPSPSGEPCVSIEAVPTLYFDPGDGSGAIECDPAGTRFDPEGPEPSVQAEPPACAHIYDQHTSELDRYPVEVWMEWNATWTSTGTGGDEPISGTFDPVQLAADDVPARAVDEVQAVVDDVQLGENAQ